MLILEYHPIIGGAQGQLAEIAPELKKLGVEVQVVTRRYPGLAAFEIIDGVSVHRLPAPGPKALASAIFRLAALSKLRALQPHVIHAYSLFSPASTAVLAKRLWGTPVAVKVLRGGALGDIVRLKHKPFAKQRIALYREKLDAFITISQEIDDELERLEISAEKRPYIPNGVDTQKFKPISSEEKEDLRRSLGLPDGPLAVYAGRLVPEKRVDLLLDAWRAVNESAPQAHLLVLGSGSQETNLRNRNDPRVHFFGRVENVAPFLQTADLFVLPSATEGLSNALLEAMSCGLACLVTRVGGALDVIQHKQSGWLVPPDDLEALQKDMLTLLNEANLRLRLGSTARNRIQSEYALTVTAVRLRNLYDALYLRDNALMPTPVLRGDQK